jgi:hypothetical protein
MRLVHAQQSRAAVGGAVSGLPHRWGNLLISLLCGAAAVYLGTAGRWAPGASASAAVFGVFAAGPLLFEALRVRWPRSRLLLAAESFWLLPVVTVGHGFLGPLVDALHSRLLDAHLARADMELFGAPLSLTLGQLVPPWLTEVLLVCYYSYFFWPVVLGGLLWARGKRAEFSQYAFALTVLYLANFLGYLLVPAIGPRFYLTGLFDGPLQGLYLAPVLDGLMRMPPFLRDCFPSGHTATTLVVLVFAWRLERRFFWVMLLPALGLILATLVGRFHYGVDLVFAIPLVVATLSAASLAVRPGTAPARAARGARLAPGLGGRRQQPA